MGGYSFTMEKLDTEDGQLFIKNLARFVRTHEKALANALQMRRQSSRSLDSKAAQSGSSNHGRASSTSSLAAAFSFGPLNFSSYNVKPAKLTLTPHHLFYLLSRFEDLSVSVGPMNIRLENINTEASSAYVSFLNKPQRTATDRDSIHSVSSVRSVGSTMSAFWASFGLGSKDPEYKSEKARAALDNDLKYLYSAFTKIPCLRLAPDYKARLIRGYEEFPFDTAVPLHSFKNLSALEVIDIDFRSFYGWDRLAEQLRTLTLKRANIDDPADLLTRIVLDDIDKRRRRSSKSQPSPVLPWSSGSSPPPLAGSVPLSSTSAPGSPIVEPGFGTSTSPMGSISMVRGGSEGARARAQTESNSPTRQASSSKHVGYRHKRGSSTLIRRSGSGSSNSSETSTAYQNNSSTSNLVAAGILPPSKWRFLRQLSLADNSLTSIGATSLAPVAGTLHSLDLSWNLFTEVPDSLASLVSLRSLNLSHCMIDSLHSLAKNPLPAITALNLRGNRLRSIAGIERSLSLERLDLRENNIPDPTEIARLTAIPYIREIWISGNPFTKSYSGYRVTIFNLFRKTPGFSEDILIDGSGPGYSEKKQLVERVVEREGAPVVRPPEPEITPTVVEAPAPATTRPHVTKAASSPVARRVDKPLPEVPANREPTVGSSRKKKSHRRRVIDLTQDDPTSTSTSERSTNDVVKPAVKGPPGPDPFIVDTLPEETPETPDETERVEASSSTHRAANPTRTSKPNTTNTTTSDISKPRSLMPAIEGLDFNGNGDVYRQRLEALKQEVGANWLSVLGDESWDKNQGSMGVHAGVSEFGPAGTIRPTSLPRTNSQVIVSGARTLG